MGGEGSGRKPDVIKMAREQEQFLKTTGGQEQIEIPNLSGVQKAALRTAVALGSGAVDSVFTRTGAVVAATNDYTWAQIDKTTSSVADITTRAISDTTGTLAIARGGTNNTSAYTSGSVLFSDGTKVTQNNANLFWDGNLGIGTTIPAALLHLSGGDILLSNAKGITIKDSGGTARSVLNVWSDDYTYLYDAGGQGIKFNTLGGTNLMTILNGGNVGIGTTTPRVPLQVNGIISGSAYLGSWSGSAVAIAVGGTGQTTQTAAMDALSPTTTAGDLLIDDGTNVVRLARGTDNQVLTATASTINWEAAAGGGKLELISHQTPSAASNVEFASITGYKYVYLIYNLSSSRSGLTVNLNTRFNNSLSGSYSFHYDTNNNTVATIENSTSGSFLQLGDGDGGMAGNAMIMINKQNPSGHVFVCNGYSYAGSSFSDTFKGMWKGDGSNSITEIDLFPNLGTISGFVTLYGVKET